MHRAGLVPPCSQNGNHYYYYYGVAETEALGSARTPNLRKSDKSRVQGSVPVGEVGG